MVNTSNEIPHKTVHIIHDFRLAVFSFDRNFTEIANFTYDTADLIIHPQGMTNVSYSVSTASAVTGGQFTLIGQLGGDVEQQNGLDFSDKILNSKITKKSSLEPVQNLSLNLSSIFNNNQSIIKKMDYIAIFTKDPRTNRWYGSTQKSNTSVPKDAKPKFVGIISDITGSFSAAQSRIDYTIKFKTLLRLVELTRYTVQASLFDEISTPTGVALNHGDVIKQALYAGKNVPGHTIVNDGLVLDYPNALLNVRTEDDNFRIVPTQLNNELLTPSNFFSAWETKLNFYRQAANNKDFEFYADEDGTIVWKFPTLARGINTKEGNYAPSELFNPDTPTAKLLYHIDDFLSFNFTDSDAELVNFVSGVSDYGVVGLGQNSDTNGALSTLMNAYYIKGGTDTPPDKLRERNYGILDIGLRPMQFRNNLFYNPPTSVDNTADASFNISQQQLYYYDFKVWKNNISKGITATLTMIDNPYIQVGMPIIIPQFAESGFGELKGRVLPSIFYISGLSRKYEYQKAPILTLTLTHGRYAHDEFHNGIHIYDKISEWCKQIEPTLLYDVTNHSLLDNGKRKQELVDLVKNNFASVQSEQTKAHEKEKFEANKATGEIQ